MFVALDPRVISTFSGDSYISKSFPYIHYARFFESRAILEPRADPRAQASNPHNRGGNKVSDRAPQLPPPVLWDFKVSRKAFDESAGRMQKRVAGTISRFIGNVAPLVSLNPLHACP